MRDSQRNQVYLTWSREDLDEQVSSSTRRTIDIWYQSRQQNQDPWVEVINDNCSYPTMEWASSLENEFFILGGMKVKLNNHIIQLQKCYRKEVFNFGRQVTPDDLWCLFQLFFDSLVPVKSQVLGFKRHKLVSFLKKLLRFHSKMEKGKQIGFDVKQEQTGFWCFLRFSTCPYYRMKISYIGCWKILKEWNHTYFVPSYVLTVPSLMPGIQFVLNSLINKCSGCHHTSSTYIFRT